jgi:hypothetical protein
MKVLGIDVGVKVSHYVITSRRRVVEKGKLISLDFDVKLAGIDAPLSFPEKGSLRECEKNLYRIGIKLFPSGADFFRPVVLKGIEIARALEKSIEVFEVYPYATRKILGIAPDAKKNVRSGLERIKADLRKFIDFEELENKDLVDAALSALTVELYVEGKTEFVSGKDGRILIPKP